MNAEVAIDRGASPAAEKLSSGASRIIRRVHMYLALFLAPWMLMYALSTLAMSHRQFVLSFYPTKTPKMETERELDYSRTFAATSTPQERGDQILQDLGLDGTHRVSGGKDGKPLVVDRQHALAPRRITFDDQTGKITVQREEFRGLTFLERMHRRRGYQQPYGLEDTWAFGGFHGDGDGVLEPVRLVDVVGATADTFLGSILCCAGHLIVRSVSGLDLNLAHA